MSAGTRNRGGVVQLTEARGGSSEEAIRDRELELWNLLLNHEGRRELAIEHWNGELTGHAMALARLQIISVEELNEMLKYADAAYSYVIEHRDTEAWVKELGKTSTCPSAGV
ncbi:hypothetical protein [Pseudomonas sp. LS-2]|uniref:hypothetical protein n=1 Tax=Pseudomonas sp. LS-2 TaxID=2315859 RepID=UPI001058D5AC|nr:hypothetical protein [Pseudomonas sp. LS-2]